MEFTMKWKVRIMFLQWIKMEIKFLIKNMPNKMEILNSNPCFWKKNLLKKIFFKKVIVARVLLCHLIYLSLMDQMHGFWYFYYNDYLY